MFQIKNNLLLLNIFVFILLGLLFITNNSQVMGMGNKHSNNDEISNDEEYVWYINAEFAIQNELTNFKINDEKKDELLKKQKFITKAIHKYNKIKNNNQLSTTYSNQPESSQRNISSKIEEETDLLDNSLQFINSIKKNSKDSIDKPESSKKNDYKKLKEI